MGLIRTAAWTMFVLILAVAAIAVLPLVRRPLLESAGRLLTYDEPLHPADLAVVTAETGPAGELEAADLYKAGVVPRVAVLVPSPRAPEVELARRGVTEDGPLDILARLGVPRRAMLAIPAGEGGTTQGSAALARWCRAHPLRHLLVIVSPHHAARVRRALRRAIGPNGPVVAVRMTKYAAFRPDTWWQSRATAREGVMELEKLLLDYAAHPF